MPCVLLLPRGRGDHGELDVKRLGASIAIAGRTQGFDDRERRSAVLEIVVGIGFGAIFLTKGVASL